MMTGQLIAILGFAFIVHIERRRYERIEAHKRDCDQHATASVRVERRNGRWTA